ncbi:MAG: ATP-binding protein, partial [Bacteroidota bacterium]
AKSEDYKGAYRSIRKWSFMKDSIFNEEKIETLALKHEYELSLEREQKLAERQKAELSGLKAEQSEKESLIFKGFIIFFLVFSIVLIIQQQRLKTKNDQLSELNTLKEGFNRQLNLTNDKLDQNNIELEKKNKKIALLSDQGFHFTKNSLSAIIGMLNAKYRSVKNSEVKAVLLAERLRMETIGILYGELFSKRSNKLDMGEYLERIVCNTIESFKGFDHNIQVGVSCGKLDVSSKQASDIAIIVNEVCINACKFAFKGDEGVFTVSLQEGNDSLELIIADSGNGFPPDFDFYNASSFGLSMIKVLAESLEASISVESKASGLSYKLSIPKDE